MYSLHTETLFRIRHAMPTSSSVQGKNTHSTHPQDKNMKYCMSMIRLDVDSAKIVHPWCMRTAFSCRSESVYLFPLFHLLLVLCTGHFLCEFERSIILRAHCATVLEYVWGLHLCFGDDLI